MAIIVLTTHGSSGDLNPFLALGLGLRERGHEVRFALSQPLVCRAEAAGFPVHRLADDAPLTGQAAIYQGGSSVGSLKAAVQQTILPTLEQKVEDLRAACAGADLLVAASLQLPASVVADLTGIPWASVAVAPLALPSADFPPSPMPSAPAPLRPLMNRIAWSVGARLLDPIADPAVNALRARYGLAPRRRLLLDGGLSDALVAVAVSPAFLPRPADWPEQARVTGFCFWDTPGSWEAPATLDTFLAGSQPVVAVSSGSQSPEVGDAFAAFYRAAVAAVRQAGARALVIGAAPGTLTEPLPPDVLTLPFAPFSQIYPRCAAAIHHGGIGTAAQALRAGLPSLVAPWGFDQFFIADRIAQLGAGLRLDRKRDTTERIAGKLTSLLRQPAYRIRARELASQIEREDGVGALCNALELVLARGRQLITAP
jgi:UDP:flavonoid glycosyltransferase YjiC (YdhE family)